MDVESIKLNTLARLPTTINGIEIFPLTLKEIILMGHGSYIQALNLVTLDQEQLFGEEAARHIPADFSIADVIFLSNQAELIHQYTKSLALFLRTDIEYHREQGLSIGGSIVSSEAFQQIIHVIKIQNCIRSAEEGAFNPLNEQARKIKEQMLRNQKKIHQLKQEDTDESLNFSDLISILCSRANGLNLFNVFDLNMFQFHNQFSRMKLLDDYEMNIQALLHGADSKQIQFKHWISKLT
ncbi:hypothetical protein [Paenibacillus sp. y28]|uniref:hypothetical protein n=1 Tax=Paenibacillus sp. y28 TaxID=3129110 RepID=UPI00301A01D0